MKKWILVGMIFGMFLTGCQEYGEETQTLPEKTETNITPRRKGMTTAAEILDEIWAHYGEEERFAVYGGLPEEPVAEKAGDLDMERSALWSGRYPIGDLSEVTQGASLTHLLNGRIFTCTVFRLRKAEKIQSLAADWRKGLQTQQWVFGAPERLLLAQVRPEYLLMAYGSKGQMALLQRKLLLVYPKAWVIYSEPITN